MRVLIVASCNSGHLSPFVIEQALEKLGCQIDYMGIVGKGCLGYLSNYRKLIFKIRNFKPDIIHAHYGLSGLLAVLQFHVPVVITFHNGETLSTYANLLSSLAAIKADFIIYVAEHIREKSYYKAKHYTIQPCGINLQDCNIIPKDEARRLLNFEDGKKYILFGGAFDNLRKNFPLLRDAISLLPEKEKIVCLEMKGLSRLECIQRMCACDVFVLPTKSEGSPQALKEAMACNCPIVATNVADIQYLLGNIKGHYICSFDPHDLADKIVHALYVDERTFGRQRILTLGLSNITVAKNIIKIYKQLLQQH